MAEEKKPKTGRLAAEGIRIRGSPEDIQQIRLVDHDVEEKKDGKLHIPVVQARFMPKKEKLLPKILKLKARPQAKETKKDVKTGIVNRYESIDITGKKLRTGNVGGKIEIEILPERRDIKKARAVFRPVIKQIQKEEIAAEADIKEEMPAPKKIFRLKLKPAKKEEKILMPNEIRTGHMLPAMVPYGVPWAGENRETKAEVEPGIGIPDIPNIEVVNIEEFLEEKLKTVNITYPLIPRAPRKGEKIFAYAHIFWDSNNNELVYHIVEPQLNETEKVEIEEIKEYIQEKVDVNFAALKKKQAIEYISNMFDKALDYFDIKISEKRDKYKYYILRDFVGLGKIEPLMKDDRLEDISCDGTGIPVYVYHRNPRFGSLKTNVFFSTKQELDFFVAKISERCGKTISIARPLLDGTLPDGSRIQATLASDIARLGSNYTIRKFTEMPLTPVDLITLGTIDIKTLSFLWLCVEHGTSILISGGTATGKTSMLNVLSMFIRPQMKIVSIEDTAELRLPHPHWIPEVSRAPVEEKGEIDMYELLKESLRQRPDYIIVGEVRGREAYVLFQQIAIGHPGLATLHAENLPKLIDRLTTAPISLPSNLLQNLDIIIFLKRIRKHGRYMRRVNSVIEIYGYESDKQKLLTNELTIWDAIKDEIKILKPSVLLKKIAIARGMTNEEIKKDLENRGKILEWMIKKKVANYRDVGKIVNLFYTSPEYLMEKIEVEL